MEYFKQVDWFISILVGVMISVMANIVTPLLLDGLSKLSRRQAEKRLAQLKREAERMYELGFNDALIIYGARSILRILVYLSTAGIVIAASLLPGRSEVGHLIDAVLLAALCMGGAVHALRSMQTCYRVSQSSEYNKALNEKIEKLQINRSTD